MHVVNPQAEETELERELLRLLEASSLLLASPESKDVLDTLLSLGQRFIKADAHAVWWKEQSGNWDMVAVSGLSRSYAATVSDSSDSGQLLATPLAVEDIRCSPMLATRAEQYEAEGILALLVVPLHIHGRAAGTMVFYYRSAHRFSESERRIGTALGNLAASALTTSQLYTEQKRLRENAELSNRRAKLLAEAAEVISSSLDYESTLGSIADRAVPDFADWCSVDIIENSEVRRVATKHLDPEKLELVRELARRYPPRDDDAIRLAMRTGSSLLMEDIPDHLISERARDAAHAALIRRLNLKSLIIAPMAVHGRTLGCLTFATAESGRRYLKADLKLTEEIAHRAAIAIDNAMLFEQTRATQRQLEAANEDLRRANNDLEQFAYSASHDLKEPLRNVAIYSEMISRKFTHFVDQDAQDYLGFIVQNARRMDALLNDLLAFTRAGVPGASEGEPQSGSASQALEGAIRNLASSIAETSAQIDYDPLPVVPMQPIHLEQLFQNLISNALKYRSHDLPSVHIAARREDHGWVFSVRDNGIGIQPEYQERIFGIFKRLHNADEYPGTGIGLAICKRIVERYHGRIWVESKPAQGSTFFFTVPV